MSGPVDEIERAILDHVFTDPAYTPPATWWLCLSTTTPADDGSNFTEPGIGGYVRLATTAADWAAAIATTPATKANSNIIDMPPSTGTQGIYTHFGLALTSTVGAANIKFFGALALSVNVNAVNQVVRFAIGALVLATGDPGDPY